MGPILLRGAVGGTEGGSHLCLLLHAVNTGMEKYLNAWNDKMDVYITCPTANVIYMFYDYYIVCLCGLVCLWLSSCNTDYVQGKVCLTMYM